MKHNAKQKNLNIVSMTGVVLFGMFFIYAIYSHITSNGDNVNLVKNYSDEEVYTSYADFVAAIDTSEETIESEVGELFSDEDGKKVSLQNGGILFSYLSESENRIIKNTIIDFFTYAYPEVKTITIDEGSNKEEHDEDNARASFKIKTDDDKEYIIKAAIDGSKLSEVSIWDDSGKYELFTYDGQNDYDYASKSYVSIADALFDYLPYEDAIDNNKYGIYYYPDISGKDFVIEFSQAVATNDLCKKAKQQAMDWVLSLKLGYDLSMFSTDNFTCVDKK